MKLSECRYAVRILLETDGHSWYAIAELANGGHAELETERGTVRTFSKVDVALRNISRARYEGPVTITLTNQRPLL